MPNGIQKNRKKLLQSKTCYHRKKETCDEQLWVFVMCFECKFLGDNSLVTVNHFYSLTIVSSFYLLILLK